MPTQVECEDNIGKMVVIDAETGEYAVDRSGIHSAIALKSKNPDARLFTIRIDYDIAVAFGGNIERVTCKFNFNLKPWEYA
jgi:hypothetical protein